MIRNWKMWVRRRIELKIKVKSRMAFLSKCFIIWFDFLFDNILIINLILLYEVCFVGKDIGRQLVKEYLFNVECVNHVAYVGMRNKIVV